jgi:Leucine-rich repeat (LRR) protein
LGELSLGGQTRATEALAILGERAPATLRALRLWQMWQQDLAPLWAAMPELRRLSLAGQALALGAFELPELERLEIVDSELSNANARVIARARWPKLAQLKLDFGTGYLTGDASIDDVFALLGRRDLPSLSRLALLHTRYIRELVRELPASPLAPQLELLDLSNNQMTDLHAIELAQHKDKFPKLQQLDVSANRLSSAGIDALGVLAPKIRALRQDG